MSEVAKTQSMSEEDLRILANRAKAVEQWNAEVEADYEKDRQEVGPHTAAVLRAVQQQVWNWNWVESMADYTTALGICDLERDLRLKNRPATPDFPAAPPAPRPKEGKKESKRRIAVVDLTQDGDDDFEFKDQFLLSDDDDDDIKFAGDFGEIKETKVSAERKNIRAPKAKAKPKMKVKGKRKRNEKAEDSDADIEAEPAEDEEDEDTEQPPKKKGQGIKAYHWCFTIHLEGKEGKDGWEYDVEEVKDKITYLLGLTEWHNQVRYIIFQVEKCPDTGRLHLQGYIELYRQFRLKGLKTLLDCNEAHCEPRRGTREEAMEYCKKEDSRLEEEDEKGIPAGPFEAGMTNPGFFVFTLRTLGDGRWAVPQLVELTPLEKLKLETRIAQNTPKAVAARVVAALAGRKRNEDRMQILTDSLTREQFGVNAAEFRTAKSLQRELDRLR